MITFKRTLFYSVALVTLVILGIAVPVMAQEATPEATPALDMQPILTSYLQSLPDNFFGLKPENALKAMSADPKPFIIDVRDEKDIGENGYIAGAVLIPIRTLTQNLDKLPAQDQQIIVYCGIGHRGGIATELLHLLGYTNVNSIFGGFAGWKAAGMPVESGKPGMPVASGFPAPEYDAGIFAAVDQFLTTMPDNYYALLPNTALKNLSADPKPFLIDVRAEAELKANGYIEGQTNIPLKTLLDDISKLPADKSQPIIVYCAIGHRGAMAMTALRLLGYTNVSSIGGGFNNWVNNGLPIIKAS